MRVVVVVVDMVVVGNEVKVVVVEAEEGREKEVEVEGSRTDFPCQSIQVRSNETMRRTGNDPRKGPRWTENEIVLSTRKIILRERTKRGDHDIFSLFLRIRFSLNVVCKLYPLFSFALSLSSLVAITIC